MNNLFTLQEYKEYLNKEREEILKSIKRYNDRIMKLETQLTKLNSTMCIIEEMEKIYYGNRKD